MDTDPTRLRAIRKLDQEALISVFDEFAPKLFRYTFRMCGDSNLADEIVGEVFLKFIEALKTGKGPTRNLRSYLYQMTYNEMVNESRRSKNLVELTDDHPVEPENLPPDRHASEEEKRRLQEALFTHLSTDQQHVVILRFFEELSIKETAAILGKSTNHIKVIQNRAIRKLHKALENQTDTKHEQQKI